MSTDLKYLFTWFSQDNKQYSQNKIYITVTSIYFLPVLFSFLYPLFKGLFIETNPVPLKYLLMKHGFISSDEVRLPLVKVNNYNSSKLDEIYNVYLKNFKGEVINF